MTGPARQHCPTCRCNVHHEARVAEVVEELRVWCKTHGVRPDALNRIFRADAARIAKLSTKTLRNTDAIPSTKIGGRRAYALRDLAEWLIRSK